MAGCGCSQPVVPLQQCGLLGDYGCTACLGLVGDLVAGVSGLGGRSAAHALLWVDVCWLAACPCSLLRAPRQAVTSLRVWLAVQDFSDAWAVVSDLGYESEEGYRVVVRDLARGLVPVQDDRLVMARV